jgi:hypothetical protein
MAPTNRRAILRACVLAGVFFASGRLARAQDTIDLVVASGRPLRVALDRRVTIKQTGQEVTATVVQPVYAYDRVVVPVGTRVLGHVAKIGALSRSTRIRAVAGGDLSPARRIELQFDTLIFADDSRVPIRTTVDNGTENVTLQIADASEKGGVVARARAEVAQKAGETISAIKAPGKMERLRDMAIRRLPYHPQFIPKGTVYSARLLAPVTFGTAAPAEAAPPGSVPAPESILNARLVTPLDSAKTPRGTSIEAVVTQPVFSADHQLILPEGTQLQGEVTVANHARRFHRNGQLRFLFEAVRTPERDPQKLLASLYSVEVSQDDHVSVDDEGGASVTNQKTRFIAPALAILALRASADREHHRFDNDADDVAGAPVRQSGNFGSRGLGGFFGWGLLGTALSQVSRPVGIAIGAVGAARTVYSSVFGKGSEVTFPADTPIQVQLAPGPATVK